MGQVQRRQKANDGSYHILINELPEVSEALSLCNAVGVVAVLVGNAVGLQGSWARQQQGCEVLQSIFCSKVQQRGQLFIPLTCLKREAAFVPSCITRLVSTGTNHVEEEIVFSSGGVPSPPRVHPNNSASGKGGGGTGKLKTGEMKTRRD